MQKKYFFYLILILELSPRYNNLNANEELDKKIDMQDFGSFYPESSQKITPDFRPNKIEKNITPNIFSRPSSQNAPFIKGAIKIDQWVDDLPRFKVLFEGQETLTDENGFFTFQIDNTDLQKYKLLITRKLQHLVNKNNTFNNLKVIPEKKYLCYSFKKLGHSQGIWLQKEKKLNQSKNFAIPKKSLVVLIDPKYIERVEDWDISLADNFIKLPRIVLKASINQNKLKRVSTKSLLCLDDSAFHEHIGRVSDTPETKNSKVKVTLP